MPPPLSSYPTPPPLSIQSTRLIGTLHVANIDASGSLVLPPSIKRLLVEVGGSSANTTLRPGKNTYVVSFQPLLTRYAQMLQQGRRPAHDMFQRLGEHYATQGIVLPFVVDRQPGMQELAVHSASGCGLPGRRCVGASGLRSVEALTIAQALRLTGTLPIEQLRLDVNGAPHPYYRVRFLWILLPIQLEQVLRCSKVPRRRSSTVCKRSCLSYSVRMALQLARPSVLMC